MASLPKSWKDAQNLLSPNRQSVSESPRSPYLSMSHEDLKKLAMESSSAPTSPAVQNNFSSIIEDADIKTKRRIFVNIPPAGQFRDKSSGKHAMHFNDNRVRTSKYTVITFLPKNLFEQFRSIANFYFLGLVVLQMFPPFNIVSPFLCAMPIMIIVAITAIKDAFEDMKRHRSDHRVNNSYVYVLSNWTNFNSSVQKESIILQCLKHTRKILKKLHSATSFSLRRKPSSDVENGPNPNPKYLNPEDYLLPRSASTSPQIQSPVKSPGLNSPAPSGPVWKLGKWKNLRVGDFVLLRNNDKIPADIVIVSTSEKDGLCYVETKNLDGETNLKIRRGIPELQWIRTPEQCTCSGFFLDCENPNPNLYGFNGLALINPKFPSAAESPKSPFPTNIPAVMNEPSLLSPISPNGILLRGCILRNTKWIIGTVIYTGADTKIMLNSGVTPSKRSKIERQMNPQILLNFMILFAMCLICAITGYVYTGAFNYGQVPWTYSEHQKESPTETAFTTFFLYEDMYHEETETSASPQAWNLCDDLGQIEYIFSDKTGTLTSNIMQFRKCSINGVIYGGDCLTDAMLGATDRDGKNTVDKKAHEETMKKNERIMRENMARLFTPIYIDEKLPFIDPHLHEHVLSGIDQGRRIREFFTFLALCHTVLVEKEEEEEVPTHEENKKGSASLLGKFSFRMDLKKQNLSLERRRGSQPLIQSPPPAYHTIHLQYNAQSPDEAALVDAAKNVGVAFLQRQENQMNVDVFGEVRTYTVLHVIEFNSDRKRMSVIVQRPEGDKVLLCKGADSVIYERLRKDQDTELVNLTSHHLAEFANDGLRTLCLAFRTIPDDVYIPWAEQFRIAQSAIKDREKEIDFVANQIENQLTLMGATAIEDRLQDGVPDTIAVLAQAGIKIWVLTGDKMETAINIGFACNLLKRSMILIVVKACTIEATKNQLLMALERFWDEQGLPISAGVNVPASKERVSHALIIDGESLKYALDSKCKALLLELGCRCKAVVCCRVSPLQKAQVVALVRHGLGAMTLAIGDGANDVSMIQEADVGIGISGKEGLQAVMASDYAIAQFRFLAKLLLVHGRWAYVRTAEVCLIRSLPGIVINYFRFTADQITDFTYGMFFQTVFTLLPNFNMGMFDQDVNDRISMMVPELYQKGIQQSLYTMERFWLYISDGVYQSIVCYYFTVFSHLEGTVNPSGLDEDKESMGTYIALSAVITVNLYMAINTFRWTWMTVIGLILSILVFVGYMHLHAGTTDSNTFGVTSVVPFQPLSYAIIVLTVIVSLFPRFVFKFIQQYFWPSDTDIVQEIEKYYWKEGEILNLNIVSEEHKSHDLESGISTHATSALHHSVNELHPLEMVSEGKNEEQDGIDKNTSKSNDLLTSDKAEASGIRRTFSESSVHPPKLSRKNTQAESGKKSPDKKEADTSSLGNMTKETSAKPIIPSIVIGHHEGEQHFGRQRSSSMSRGSITMMMQKTGQFIKSVPKRLRMPSTRIDRGGLKATSIVFMGTNEEMPNTGFCFSHEEGMTDIITPIRTNITENDEPPLSAHPSLSKLRNEVYSYSPSSSSQLSNTSNTDSPVSSSPSKSTLNTANTGITGVGSRLTRAMGAPQTPRESPLTNIAEKQENITQLGVDDAGILHDDLKMDAESEIDHSTSNSKLKINTQMNNQGSYSVSSAMEGGPDGFGS
ncbi:hypothetical protein HK098_001047 [Nowakowskiella sp. JEL0407]|nr:hypothetical protein HK098_001047 [Nowakowskiella sp. JEL0407]